MNSLPPGLIFNLRAQREKLKLTQQALADLLGITSNTVARMERGELPVLRVTQLAIEHLSCKPPRRHK